MAARHADERTMQRFHPAFAIQPGICHELLDCLADFGRTSIAGHLFAEIHGNRVGDPPRPFPNKTSLFKTEDAAPHAVEGHWDDRRIHLLHDALKPTTEGQHLADACNLSFREYTNDFSISNGLAGFA